MGSRRLSVALVTPKYPPVTSGYGNQAFAVNKILANIVDIVLLTQEQQPVEITVAHQRVQGIQQRSKNYNVLTLLMWTVRSCIWLLRKRQSYDVIHVLGAYFWAVPCVLVGRLVGKPTVVKVISREVDTFVRNSVMRRIRLKLLRSASVLVVLTEYARQAAIRSGIPAERLRIIPNGVDVERYSRLVEDRNSRRAEMNIPEECFVVLFVGQVGLRKGVDRLLRAWQEFQRKITDIPTLLVLVGEIDGSIPPETLSMVRHVRVVGHVNDPTPYYAISDCFVLLSRSEGMANVLLEAAASGIPFIVSDIPPNKELAARLGGTVVSGDETQIASRTAQELSRFARVRNTDAVRKEGMRLKQKIRSQFSLQSIAHQYLALYHELNARG